MALIKSITKAIAQSLKKNLPKISTIHAGHPMYLMRDNSKQVLQQGADNKWTHKRCINKMHKWYSTDDDDQSIAEPTVTYKVLLTAVPMVWLLETIVYGLEV